MRTIVIIIFCLSLFGCSASGRIDDVSPWYRVIKFSVDTLNIKLETSPNLKGEKLLANK